MALEEKDF